MRSDVSQWQAEYRDEGLAAQEESVIKEGAEDTDYDALRSLTDSYQYNVKLLCALFRWPGMEPSPTDSPFRAYCEILRGVMLALKDLSRARAKRLREADFTVWTGDPLYVMVGIPTSVPLAISEFLLARFRLIDGYESAEHVTVPEVNMLPKLRYQAGTIVRYDDGVAGSIILAGSIGAEVHYRNSRTY